MVYKTRYSAVFDIGWYKIYYPLSIYKACATLSFWSSKLRHIYNSLLPKQQTVSFKPSSKHCNTPNQIFNTKIADIVVNDLRYPTGVCNFSICMSVYQKSTISIWSLWRRWTLHLSSKNTQEYKSDLLCQIALPSGQSFS